MADSAAYFRQHGLDLAQGRDAEFNQYVQELDGGVKQHLAQLASGQAADEPAAALGFGCFACKAGVWVIAGAIVALGAAGVAAISPEADVVILLARFAGADARAVAGFVSGLGSIIQNGVNAVAICRWTGAC